MENRPNFDDIRELIVSLAKMHGETTEQMHSPTYRLRDIIWHWDYKRASQQAEYENELFFLAESIRLHEAAMKDGDLLAANKGIMMAQMAAQNLSGFFDSLMEDLRTVMRDSEKFQWPEFPDPYEVPAKYDYKGL